MQQAANVASSVRTQQANDWLSAAAADVTIPTYTSQRGEDRILQRLFAVIGTTSQWCVEFGATDGRHFSNTWYWINKQHWHSVQIEGARDIHLSLRTPGRDSFEALAERYKDNERVLCLNRWVTIERPNTLDAILSKTALPREFDLLSIDIDGNDYAIWESLTDYTPRVVVIEHIKTIPIETNFHSDRGSSLRALTELGKRKGYELVAANDLNGIFVRQELFPLLGIHDNSPETLWRGHEAYRMGADFSLEGHLVFRGPSRLRWVRGKDGTLAGQLGSGSYAVIKKGDKSLPTTSPYRPRVYLSGLLRHWYYSLCSRL